MPRKNKGLRVQYDASAIDKAVALVKADKMSIREAAKELGVPKSTVADRVSGRVEEGARPGKAPVIPLEVEAQIAQKVKEAGRMGFGVTRGQLCRKVGRLVQNMKLKTLFRNGIPGKDWIDGFKKRHQELSLRSPTPLNSVRARMLNPHVADRYFVDLGKVMSDLNLKEYPQRVWNIDETNVSLTHKPSKVLAEVGQRNVPGRVGNCRDGVTVLACINAAGKDIPPLVIVKGLTEKAVRSYNVAAGPAGTKYTYQRKAWMEDILGVSWFTDHFLQHCGPERPQLIILDSHSSHETLGLLEAARKNGITLFALPPHTTQYLNPLDKTVFGPFQREYNKQCSDFMCASPNNTVTKWEWPRLFNNAYTKTVNPENIRKGFEVCGIHPFDPTRVPVTAFAPSCPFDKYASSATTSPALTTQGEGQVASYQGIAEVAEKQTGEQVDGNQDVAETAGGQAEAKEAACNQGGPDVEQAAGTEGATQTADVSMQVDTDFQTSPQSTEQSTAQTNVVAAADENGNMILDDPAVLLELLASGQLEVFSEGIGLSQTDIMTEMSWSSEVGQVFNIPTPKQEPSTKTNKRKITSHRLLTSDEIYKTKLHAAQEKERIESEKLERKVARELKRSIKGQKKNKK